MSFKLFWCREVNLKPLFLTFVNPILVGVWRNPPLAGRGLKSPPPPPSNSAICHPKAMNLGRKRVYGKYRL